MQQGSNRQTDIELANLRRQHQLILNSVGEGVYGLDAMGNVTFVNPAAASLIGWEMDDLIGKSMHAILHHSKPDGTVYPREECHIYAAFKEGTVRRVDNEVFWRKDGTSFPVEYISTPMHNEKNQLVGSVVTFRDITQRKLSESILQRANEELEQRVIERTSELSKANEQLQQLNEDRSRFVAMICHEFRNPLNNISFSVSSLKRYDRQLSAQEKIEYLSDVETNIDRMTQMTNELLVIGQIETEGINLSSEKIDLVGFCQELIAELKHTYSAREIQFNSNISFLESEIDCRLLRSILTNVLTNSVRYSQGDKLIEFELNFQSDRAIFTIKDWGIGIPKGDINKIFTPFHRGKNVSNIPGTGLGLNIVKRFIDLLNGEINISSKVNQGTTVQIEIPLHGDR
ncbi:PAS domain-containing sensor histidine kinase [Waterburya agarophytonicola K14]|uniref:histidine kinase n=1 Tax=Waterburya agarophytonicola KI4 TaxID=2874699 RepID=A0A964FFL6_9CYAN|nr:PAS domain-containing sensor histidine kinase [Waterburya agarophytonicola]MCC0177132.1 PAS domain-containing sensor histidine kinase [Waterburya agarophytonicola KI4]